MPSGVLNRDTNTVGTQRCPKPGGLAGQELAPLALELKSARPLDTGGGRLPRLLFPSGDSS